MMCDREKSDPAMVAVKPTNKAGQPAAELVEPRAGAEGNVSQQSTGRAQYRGTVSQALKRIRHVARILRSAVTHPRWEPYARIGLVRICAGGARLNSRPYRERCICPTWARQPGFPNNAADIPRARRLCRILAPFDVRRATAFFGSDRSNSGSGRRAFRNGVHDPQRSFAVRCRNGFDADFSL